MNYDNLCYNCMHEKPDAGMKCPVCGCPPGVKRSTAATLEPSTILKGRYLVGNMVNQKEKTIEYIALDLQTELVVSISELYLSKQMRRSTRHPGRVRLLSDSQEAARSFQEHKRKFREESERYIQQSRPDEKGRRWTDCFEENGTVYTVRTHQNENASLQANQRMANQNQGYNGRNQAPPPNGQYYSGQPSGNGGGNAWKIVLIVLGSLLGVAVLVIAGVLIARQMFRNSVNNLFDNIWDSLGIFGDAGAEDEYTMMVYMVGSNLESDYGAASQDIWEMLTSGVDYENVNLLIYTGGSSSWDIEYISSDHTSVYQMTGEADLTEVAVTSANVNMGDAGTLADFLEYCQENYPAQHYALILWDHGNGAVNGFGNDELYNYDPLYLSEVKEALEASPFGEDRKLDWIGYDACLMSTLEVANTWKDYAGYMVASEEVESGSSWDYGFLSILNETSDPEEITKYVIDTFADYYESISSVTFDPVATLACVDLESMDKVLDALDSVLEQMTEDIEAGNYSEIAQVRAATKQFGIAVSGGREDAFDAVDLGDLAERLRALYPKKAKKLSRALEQLIVYETSNEAGTSGITLYFPFDNMERFDEYGEPQLADLLDEAYAEFITAFTECRRETDLSTDWTLEGIAVGDTELSLALTEEQAQHLAYATYTILKKTESGCYTLVRSGNFLEPDDSDVLHVSLDQYVVVLKNSETAVVWPVEQLEQVDTESLYTNQAAHLQLAGYDSTTAVSVSLCLDLENDLFSVRLINYTYGDSEIALGGKEELRLDSYDYIGCEYEEYQPAYDSTGRLLPWEEWVVCGAEETVSLRIDDSFEGYAVSLSESDDAYVIQIELQDTTGTVHASELAAVS